MVMTIIRASNCLRENETGELRERCRNDPFRIWLDGVFQVAETLPFHRPDRSGTALAHHPRDTPKCSLHFEVSRIDF